MEFSPKQLKATARQKDQTVLFVASLELLANARANATAWANVLELNLLPLRHRETAERLLADNLAVVAKAEGRS